MLAYSDHLKNVATVNRKIQAWEAGSANVLGECLDVSARTACRYVEFLRRLGAPVVYRQNDGGYRYSRSWDFGKALLKWLET